ncbi:hypothetical protein FAGAP_6774 [Fusarium agapanthi]|uniref:Uncharacterized protein n=1 Tax=Fusarium agapanthi TaxID=1803897 RepID=A0A9P5B8E9_9HYPO|nr:hypothetical protein FAGAP_6774 [Fusarium agapanthi]
MEDILTVIPQAAVKEVRVSRTAKLEFHGKQATFTHDGFTVAYGTAEAKVPSLGVDTKFDLAPGRGYFSNGKATYACQGDKMTLKPCWVFEDPERGTQLGTLFI